MSQKRNEPLNELDEARKARLIAALDESHWRLAPAADALRLSRTQIYRLVKRFGLMKPGRVLVRRLMKA